MKAKLAKTGQDYILYSESKETLAISNGRMVGRVLSIKNCEAIEMGYDLDELANKFTEHFNTFDVVKSDIQVGYKKGFQKALELMGNKKYTDDDIVDAYMVGHIRGTSTDMGEDNKHPICSEYLNSLQQTEWDVEIEMECKGGCKYLVLNGINSICCGDKKPKLDKDGCLILKRL
jgi:hypothetical protein